MLCGGILTVRSAAEFGDAIWVRLFLSAMAIGLQPQGEA